MSKNSAMFEQDYKQKLLSKSALENLKKSSAKPQKLTINDHIKKRDKHKISVIIPTHNRLSELTQLLNSIFAQSYTNYEIIIIDDVSTDDTPEFFSKLKSKKINTSATRKILAWA